MPFCRNCGHELDENTKFCPECGTNQEISKDNAKAENFTVDTSSIFGDTEPVIPPASGKLNVGLLVWSILNIVFCCLPLAIVSLVFTTTAKDAANAQEEAKKLKVARTCNIINTAVMGGLFLLIFLFEMFAAVMSTI
jgi:uncharacterized membrane protein YvbJ